MTPIDDHRFIGPDGPVTLAQLFGDRPQLVLQSCMFHPDWEEGCPSCTWSANNLPSKLDELLEPNGVSFAMVSRAPIDKLQAERRELIEGYRELLHTDEERAAYDQMIYYSLS